MHGRFTSVLQGLLPDGSGAVLLAVSGGADSRCLAELFLRSGRPFAVAHCNFRLRGEESDGDQAFVQTWCAEHGIPCHVKAFDTAVYAREHGVSIEMAARSLRYAWFDSLDYGVVAVAHNANDNAETLLLNLLRGTGLRGLTGMRPSGPLPVPGSAKKLIRPLLGFSRAEIEAFLRREGISWREDRTNAEDDARRNLLRHHVFPQLEALNPAFIQTLGRDMARFSQAADVLDDYVSEYAFLVEEGTPARIDVPGLLSRPHWKYLLYRFLEPYSFPEAVLADLTASLESYGRAPFAGKTFLSPTHRLVTAPARLEVLPLSPAPVPVRTEVLRGGGLYAFGPQRLQVEVFDRPDGFETRQAAGVLVADAEALPFPLLVRPWQEGDWMVPFGMRGRKKLSDLFTDLKYSIPRKEAALVAVVPGWNAPDTAGERVAALLGQRIDTRLSVRPATRRIVRLTLLEH